MKTLFLTFTFLFAIASFTFAQKFAYVDTKYVLDNIPEYKSAQEQLDKISAERSRYWYGQEQNARFRQ